ncbi:penicillin-binding protein [Cupriavidus consociatus]|uniref:penicillin-binding protein n=1 Tax=Cupriavidus consociatus TaxID=2821357 RepID=UPI001AE273C9|nr:MULTISPECIES: penicillin-binding protein [unclassified Cupriavidus]MBP0618629.1 penicillin-binding protein [Cupriavidus sp. LEh25]MDK2655269.1 penicillin-binding protein [Cupriavidus sp. LEh21]
MRLSLMACGGILALSACATPDGNGAFTVMTPASFDRTFTAAAGAMHDQGLAISVADPVRGVVVGSLESSAVMAGVDQLADGHVRVTFDSLGANDPALMARISSSYDRRMGR